MNQLTIKRENGLIKKKKGFTLVELIIVIAIIAILALMAIPKFSSSRMDAKVSNDVAAAKNIQSQIALGIANNKISVPTARQEVDEFIFEQLDGNIGHNKKPEALSSGKFEYEVASDGNISVFVTSGSDSYTLYPDNDGTERQEYSDKAKS